MAAVGSGGGDIVQTSRAKAIRCLHGSIESPDTLHNFRFESKGSLEGWAAEA